jgi:hypothetical protein
MSTQEELYAAYQQWRDLTDRESEAILRAAWAHVDQCQEAKRTLQDQIVALTQRLQNETAIDGADWPAIESSLRGIVRELIVMETRNSDMLASHRAEVQRQEAELECKTRNLRRVHRAYAFGPVPAWSSYS